MVSAAFSLLERPGVERSCRTLVDPEWYRALLSPMGATITYYYGVQLGGGGLMTNLKGIIGVGTPT